MAEYINKKDACDLLAKKAFDEQFVDECAELTTKECLSIIRKIPTADVVEVKHGEWIDTVTGYACSICHKQEPTKRFLYCPNCGAKMDGRSDT